MPRHGDASPLAMLSIKSLVVTLLKGLVRISVRLSIGLTSPKTCRHQRCTEEASRQPAAPPGALFTVGSPLPPASAPLPPPSLSTPPSPQPQHPSLPPAFVVLKTHSPPTVAQ
ncbi:TPA: hypothetical protein ACH3X1_009807 [Trebouxia sp. C0004]